MCSIMKPSCPENSYCAETFQTPGYKCVCHKNFVGERCNGYTGKESLPPVLMSTLIILDKFKI